MPKTLKTNRLLLRTFVQSDAPALYAYASDPRVGPRAGWKPHESVEESERIIEQFIRTDEVWAIVERKTGALIGSIGLHPSKKEGVRYDAELGYVLAAPYWGRGLMAEAAGRVIRAAFEELGVHCLCVSHFDGNTQSKRVIEKCGFRFFKRLESSFERYDGEKLGENVYLLTKEQYEQTKKATAEQQRPLTQNVHVAQAERCTNDSIEIEANDAKNELFGQPTPNDSV